MYVNGELQDFPTLKEFTKDKFIGGNLYEYYKEFFERLETVDFIIDTLFKEGFYRINFVTFDLDSSSTDKEMYIEKIKMIASTVYQGRVTSLSLSRAGDTAWGPPPRAVLRARWGKHAAAGPAQRRTRWSYHGQVTSLGNPQKILPKAKFLGRRRLGRTRPEKSPTRRLSSLQ